MLIASERDGARAGITFPAVSLERATIDQQLGLVGDFCDYYL